MAVKELAFGSKSEREGYHSINHTWGGRYRLFPQMPFSAIFTPDPSWRGDTSNLFFKTSVDYVLCTREGRPLLAIDFDGLAGGFDRGGEYIGVEEADDKYPFRKLKFDFKLKYAAMEENSFPYYVIASEELKQLGAGIELTVVDGMIGETLAHKEFSKKALSGELESISQAEDFEIDCMINHNPIVKREIELRGRLGGMIEGVAPRDGGYWPRMSVRHLGNKGVECTLHETPVGEVSATARLRSVAYHYSLEPQVAELLAVNKLYRLLLQGRR